MTTSPDAAAPAVAQPDPGSFRDPLSRVFIEGDHVWRGLSGAAVEDVEALFASSFFPAALQRGDIVATERVQPGDGVPSLGTDWPGLLRHERIGVLSYPYEWAFEMLRDAARLQLRLTREALSERLITKDASAYNVQFVGAKPVFIDVGSFERIRSGEPWPGYRQFCELFLNPLYIQAIANVPFQPLLRGDIDGVSPPLAKAIIGGRGRFRRGTFTHVRLHARVERRYADADKERDIRGELKRAGLGPKLIDAQLRNLEKAIESLSWKQQQSTWSDYSDRSHYTDRDLEAKEQFVAAATTTDASGGLVLDLGANDGRFSRIAVGAGARSVVAVDSDHLVIDRLYRDLRNEGSTAILPLVLDLANPSPSIGWRSQERPSFVERVRPDLTLCLAVVHHLALTNNVPLGDIVQFLADFGGKLVVEFPHPDDVMAKRLLARKREGLFDSYTVATWEAALERRFTVQRREDLPSGTRTLYHCTPR